MRNVLAILFGLLIPLAMLGCSTVCLLCALDIDYHKSNGEEPCDETRKKLLLYLPLFALMLACSVYLVSRGLTG